MGDGGNDRWCFENPLKEIFALLFGLALNKNGLVGDMMRWVVDR